MIDANIPFLACSNQCYAMCTALSLTDYYSEAEAMLHYAHYDNYMTLSRPLISLKAPNKNVLISLVEVARGICWVDHNAFGT